MKKTKIFLSAIVGLLSVGALATGFTYAWLSTATTTVDFDHAGGGIISDYFHCGTGTENDPYVITRPVHLYNLVELMYADSENFQVYNKCFQLGYDLDGDDETLEFYNYDDSGVLQEGVYSSVLNMKYYSGSRALMPIGQYHSSKHYPFAGVFDGSLLTVANLEIKGGTGIDDLGFFGYVTSDAQIFDLYIDNIIINVAECNVGVHTDLNLENGHAENANVGYIAGHIENSNCFTNVYVNNSSITGTGTVAIHNDWGYFGRCDNAKTLENFIGHAGVEDPSWGGSVNMSKMYSRLTRIANSATRNDNYVYEKDVVTKPDGTTTFERNATTARAYTYRNTQQGSFVFSAYSDTETATEDDWLYVSGGTRYIPKKQAESQVSGYYISYNGYNLGVNGTNLANHQDGWDWLDNQLIIYIDGTAYKLTHNLTLSTTSTDTWTKGGDRLYYRNGNRYTYLYYNTRWRTANANRTSDIPNLTWAQTTITRITESSNGDPYMDYSGTNVTYFPLVSVSDSDYAASGKNTGYVIGGSEDKTTSTTYPYKTGDIRVSRYSTTNIGNSYSNRTLNHVYTINGNNKTVEINSNTFVKYLDSKDDFLSMITGGNIYGLHFMSASISKDQLVTADYALINGIEKSNYQMPTSSIDFHLMSKGIINFFAGTYFTNNNSFFSLHHIERDEEDNIVSINEIDEIYESTNSRKKYIYKYMNGDYSGELDSSYSSVFSTSRIKVRQDSNTWKGNAVYYFEIPVNAGEYALGSVDGGTGAYLMYLDIGANGGIDFNADVDSFGSVEYRSTPDVAEASLVLITYQQSAGQSVNLAVVYIEQNSIKKYYITCSGTIEQITITVLSKEIEVYYNDEMLPQQIKSNIKTVPASTS